MKAWPCFSAYIYPPGETPVWWRVTKGGWMVEKNQFDGWIGLKCNFWTMWKSVVSSHSSVLEEGCEQMTRGEESESLQGRVFFCSTRGICIIPLPHAFSSFTLLGGQAASGSRVSCRFKFMTSHAGYAVLICTFCNKTCFLCYLFCLERKIFCSQGA